MINFAFPFVIQSIAKLNSAAKSFHIRYQTAYTIIPPSAIAIRVQNQSSVEFNSSASSTLQQIQIFLRGSSIHLPVNPSANSILFTSSIYLKIPVQNHSISNLRIPCPLKRACASAPCYVYPTRSTSKGPPRKPPPAPEVHVLPKPKPQRKALSIHTFHLNGDDSCLAARNKASPNLYDVLLLLRSLSLSVVFRPLVYANGKVSAEIK